MSTIPELSEQLKKANDEIHRLRGLLTLTRKKVFRLQKRIAQ